MVYAFRAYHEVYQGDHRHGLRLYDLGCQMLRSKKGSWDTQIHSTFPESIGIINQIRRRTEVLYLIG